MFNLKRTLFDQGSFFACISPNNFSNLSENSTNSTFFILYNKFMPQPKIIVSACLAGQKCRYNGTSASDPEVIALVESGQAIPVCPELLAGFSIPRPPAEIKTQSDGTQKVITAENGQDLTEQFEQGAQKATQIAQQYGCTKALLKSKSPSCGYQTIYDGTFSGTMTTGHGFFTKKLLDLGLEIESRQ